MGEGGELQEPEAPPLPTPAEAAASLERLRQRTVLIVEPDGFAAGYITARLTQLEARVVGPLARLADAADMLAAGDTPAAAIVDARALDRGAAAVLAELVRLAVPLMILGDPGADWPELPHDAMVMQRPFAAHQVAACLAELLARG